MLLNRIEFSYFYLSLSLQVLSKIFDSNDKRAVKGIRLKNHLFDDPTIYIKPAEKFIVARLDRKSGPLLENGDFKSLNDGHLTIQCAGTFWKF